MFLNVIALVQVIAVTYASKILSSVRSAVETVVVFHHVLLCSSGRHTGRVSFSAIPAISTLFVAMIAAATLTGCDHLSQMISGEAKFKEDYIKQCVADSQNATFGLFGTDNLGEFCACTYDETRKTVEYKDWVKIKNGEIGLADARSMHLLDASARALTTCAGSPSKERQ